MIAGPLNLALTICLATIRSLNPYYIPHGIGLTKRKDGGVRWVRRLIVRAGNRAVVFKGC